MQAVRIHRFGGPEVMALEEIDRPPSANEVLIKVSAASVNPVDAKMREGKYPVVTEKNLPYVLGRDVSGQIAAAGDNVSTFLIGDDVFAFLSPEHGGYEEFVLARVDEVAAKPKSLDQVGAAAVPLAGITAWQGLFDHGGLRPANGSSSTAALAVLAISPFSSPKQSAPGSQPPYPQPTRSSLATSGPIR